MPIYEYQCKGCEKVHEMVQKITDPPAANCPDCGAALEKLMSLSSFSLKGGGWYRQGYDGKSNAKSGSDKKEVSSAGGKADSKESAKSDSPKPTSENKKKTESSSTKSSSNTSTTS